MASTLVGVFDDHKDANEARDRLLAVGIEREAIQVTRQEATADTGQAYAAERPAEQGGIRGFFASLFGSDDGDESGGHYSEAVRRGGIVLAVDIADDSRVEQVSQILEACGAIDIDERVERWKAAGYAGYDPNARPYTDEEIARERETLQVIEEQMKVGKRAVERGVVRVHRRITETPVEEKVTLRDERAVVDRRPVDRPASSADLQAFKEGEIEIRETTEEPVVSKSARVVEEVSVGKQASEHTETVQDKVRRSDVDVERSGEGTRTAGEASSRYSGPERRKRSGGYGGAERRAGI